MLYVVLYNFVKEKKQLYDIVGFCKRKNIVLVLQSETVGIINITNF